MKPARLFQQYIWLVNTLRQKGKLTLKEINDLWVNNKVIGGSPLSRTSFYRHKEAILNMMGIIIECEKNTNKYFISNPEELDDDSIGRWMLSTLTVNNALSDCAGIKNRILLENAPSGEEFLEPVINAIKTDHRLKMGYRKFNSEGYVKVICPYALKRFQQRWYLLALNDEEKMRIYAIDDRTMMMEMTDQTFEMPEDFSPEEYFAEYFGVLTDGTPLAHIVIRAYGKMASYLHTLPLHDSQKELERTDEYTDYSLDLRPTADFVGELLSYDEGVEVLEPADLRLKIREKLRRMLNRY